MTTATEQGGYDRYAVPEAPEGSRFYVATSAGGWPAIPARNVAADFQALCIDRVASVPSVSPGPVTVKLFWADGNGLRERGEIVGVPAGQNVRPSRVWNKGSIKGGALLDSLFLGGDAWEKATDRECFQALADYAAEVELTGGLRSLNDSLCLLVAGRAGITGLTEYDLPHPFPLRANAGKS